MEKAQIIFALLLIHIRMLILTQHYFKVDVIISEVWNVGNAITKSLIHQIGNSL